MFHEADVPRPALTDSAPSQRAAPSRLAADSRAQSTLGSSAIKIVQNPLNMDAATRCCLFLYQRSTSHALAKTRARPSTSVQWPSSGRFGESRNDVCRSILFKSASEANLDQFIRSKRS
jgi:hypothetical protein